MNTDRGGGPECAGSFPGGKVEDGEKTGGMVGV